ncbi:hypothetical protein AB0L41_01735 [Amycolatopsis mediterranei]|uniref:wHTH domain-containing protein n=1 Tax=Amycolatopsis mediterranei TaxID=33910 RepID=UPI003429C91A
MHLECAGLTLDGIAKGVHRSRSQIGDILNGRIQRVPDLDVILRIVAKCASYAAESGIPLSLSTSPDYWRRAHGALELALADPAEGAPSPVASDDWIQLAKQHSGDDAVGRQIVALASHLAAERIAAEKQLAGDPWRDTALARRVVSWASELADETLVGEHRPLSSGETALMVLAPMLYQVLWLRTATCAEVNPLDLTQTGADDQERASFERFLRGRQQQRLVSRTRQVMPDRSSSIREIGWWLFHRWLDARQPDPRAALPLAEWIDDPPLRRMLLEPLEQLVRLFRLSAAELRNSERHGLPVETGGSLSVPGLRVRLVGVLLALGHSLAIDVTGLSGSIAEHLGIPEPVDLTDLRLTLNEVAWRRGAEMDLLLHARCRHEAVLEALSEHVQRTDILLGVIHALAQHDMTLQSLRVLPARASSGRVLPALEDGEPIFSFPVSRFGLDESRVRELLMGEQLYRDRALAIRELYQNALDACRYRQARHRYQAEKWGLRSDWTGKISFEQGVDLAGRHFLSCSDNGVGMGEVELREVFSQAGIRFADRPEFAEEQAEWAECGVDLHPNSRFGIGVMSYFMLADEIEVSTCRMSRQTATPGPQLKVLIAGPGHLFRIKRIADHGERPGTEVKLYLRDPADAPSCVRTLRALLGIAEFATRAEHDGATASWEPFVFQPRQRETWESIGINAHGRLETGRPGEMGQVIWCEHGGALLVDGIYVQANNDNDDTGDPRGAVVNLTGRLAPVLTVDRNSVLSDVSGAIDSLLGRNTDVLISGDGSFLSYGWIIKVADSDPGVADIVTRAAISAKIPLHLAGAEIDVRRTGVVEMDLHLTEDRTAEVNLESKIRSWEGAAEHILLWRLMALVDGAIDGLPQAETILHCRILPAVPSDAAWMAQPPKRHVFAAEKVGLTVGEVAKKSVALKLDFREAVELLARRGMTELSSADVDVEGKVSKTDVLLLSSNLSGEWPWWEVDTVIPAVSVLAASIRAETSPNQVKRRLQEFGFSVSSLSEAINRADSLDLRILSKRLDSKEPWIRQEDPVPVLHVASSAWVQNKTFAEMRRHFERFGFSVTAPLCDEGEIDCVDSQIRAGVLQFLAITPVEFHVWNVLRASVLSLCPPWKLKSFFDKLGIEIDGGEKIPESLSFEAVKVLSARFAFRPKSISSILIQNSQRAIPLSSMGDILKEMGIDFNWDDRIMLQEDPVNRRIISLVGSQIQSNREVSVRVVVYVAGLLAESPSMVADRMKSMSIIVPNIEHLPERIRESDALILGSRNDFGLEIMGQSDIQLNREIPIAHLVRVCHESLLSPNEVAERLGELGYRVSFLVNLPRQFDQRDITLVSWVSSATRFWQDPFIPVSLGNLIRSAIRCRISLREAANRMTQLGFALPDLDRVLSPVIARLAASDLLIKPEADPLGNLE